MAIARPWWFGQIQKKRKMFLHKFYNVVQGEWDQIYSIGMILLLGVVFCSCVKDEAATAN